MSEARKTKQNPEEYLQFLNEECNRKESQIKELDDTIKILENSSSKMAYDIMNQRAELDKIIETNTIQEKELLELLQREIGIKIE